MPFRYQSGADPLTRSAETEWYIQEYGGGVMVMEPEPKKFGRVFLTETEKDEDLIFIGRR